MNKQVKFLKYFIKRKSVFAVETNDCEQGPVAQLCDHINEPGVSVLMPFSRVGFCYSPFLFIDLGRSKDIATAFR